MGPDELWVGMLGPFEVRVDAELAGPGGARRRGLLALLAAEPNVVHPVASIIDRLWGEESPDSAVNVVQTYVSAWRKVLGGRDGPLERVGAGYRLTLAADECDVLAFRALADRARTADDRRAAADHWRAALDLWRGPPLADLVGEAFHDALATPLEAERARVIEQWAEAALAVGDDPDDVLARLQEAQARDPLRESTTVLVMRAQALAGRQAAALDAYDALRRRLDEELATIPGPALQDMHQRILRNDPELRPRADVTVHPTVALASTSRDSAPADRFFGRVQELEDVATLLDQGRLVTLAGPGGSGKTRLALELLDRHLATAEPGWFVELAPVRDPALAPSAVASALGLGVAAGTDPADVLIERLSEVRGLLVLDNVEHLAGVASFVRRMHRGCRDLRLLLTSRQALQLEGEQQYAVPVLPVPGSGQLDDVVSQASVQLLVDRVRAHDATFQVTEANAGDVALIVQHLDGLPLAIEIVAPWVRLHGPAAMVERLAHGRLDLQGRRSDSEPRHRSLRETIGWSHEMLGDREQVVFRRLAVFPATFGLAAAAAVVSADDPQAAEELLLNLVDSNLVQAVAPVSGQPRFRILVVVREFALERLADDPDQDEVHDRMLRWYMAWTAELAAHSEGPESPQWLALTVAEADNIRAAIDHCGALGRHADQLQLVVDAMTLWFEAGHEEEGERRLRVALDLAGVDAPSRAIGLTYWAWLRAPRDSAAAAAAALEARDFAVVAGEVPVEAFALQTLGDSLADPREAVEASRAALEACDRAAGMTIRYGPTAPDAVRCGASASIAISWTYRSLPEALDWQTRALRRAELEGDRRITAVNCARLAHLHLLTWDVASASDLLERARELVSDRVSGRWEDIVAVGDALLARHQERVDDAERILRSTANGSAAAGRIQAALAGGVALADLCLDTARPVEAEAALERVSTVGAITSAAHVARLEVRRARIDREQGRAGDALSRLEAMSAALDDIEGMPPEKSLWLIELAALKADAGEASAAFTLLEELEAGLVRAGLRLAPWELARAKPRSGA